MKLLKRMASWGLIPWLLFVFCVLFAWYIILPQILRWLKPANNMDLTPQQVAAMVRGINDAWMPSMERKDACFQLLAGYNSDQLRDAMSAYRAQFGTSMYEDVAGWMCFYLPWQTDNKQAALTNMQAAL